MELLNIGGRSVEIIDRRRPVRIDEGNVDRYEKRDVFQFYGLEEELDTLVYDGADEYHRFTVLTPGSKVFGEQTVLWPIGSEDIPGSPFGRGNVGPESPFESVKVGHLSKEQLDRVLSSQSPGFYLDWALGYTTPGLFERLHYYLQDRLSKE